MPPINPAGFSGGLYRPDVQTAARTTTPAVGGLKGVGTGIIASGVISSLTEIATGFINAARTKQTYEFNAAMQALQGRMIRLQADVEIKNIRKKAQTLFSAQRAGYARAGFAMEGSPVAVMLASQKEMELDIIYSQISADYEVGLTRTQADIYKMRGKSAEIDAWTGAGTTILKTISQ